MKFEKWNKEIKHFEKIIEIILIILTVFSFIINTLTFTNALYNHSYDTGYLNSFVTSQSFYILLLLDNFLIYLVSIFYLVSAIQSKKDVLIKISFTILSIVTTITVATLIINFVASIFGVF